MKLQEAKNKVQSDALNAWYKRGCKGTLQLCTGAGKTRTAIKAIEYVLALKSNANILIITPTEIIRDEVFPNEFKKWKLKNLIEKVDIQCIQTVYKWEGNSYDLIIADEIHNYMPKDEDYDSLAYEYHKFFDNNSYTKLLGLSAWIPDDKRKAIRKVSPVAFTLTTDKGVELGVISPYIEWNIPVEMTEDEQKRYNQIQMAYFNLERRLGGQGMAFKNAKLLQAKIQKIPKNQRTPQDNQSLSVAVQFWRVMQKRKKFLYQLPSKVKAVHDLIDQLGIDKSVIFSQATDFADMIAKDRDDIIQYHSKVKDRKAAMKKFEDGRTKVNHLSTCMAVNEGMDLPRLPSIIIASRTSGAKAHIQRRGRCLRFEEDKVSFVFNLYIAGTQDEKWLVKSQSTTDKSRIQHASIEEIAAFIKSSSKAEELKSIEDETAL